MTLPGRLLTTLFTAALACRAAAAAELPPKPSLADVIKASRPSDWRPLDPANTLYMELPGGRVVIELAPAFAPRHVANIRTLVHEHYFDGLAVIRSQDNWVGQWGDADEKNPKSLRHRGRHPARRIHHRPAQRPPVHPPARPRRLRPRGRPLERLPVRARPENRARLAGPLLRHGGRRPRQRRRQRQRQLALRRHRPGAPPPGPQHHRGRPRRRRHAAAVDHAARPRPDGLFRPAIGDACRSLPSNSRPTCRRASAASSK